MKLEEMIQFIYKEKSKINYVIFTFIKNENDVEIIFDRIIDKIINNYLSYDIEKSKFNTWFYTILKNECLLYLKKKTYKLLPNYNYNLVENELKIEKTEKDKIEKFLYNEVINYINNIKNKRTKEILTERFINKRKTDEISKLLNIAGSTVRVTIKNGKEKIKNYLEKKYPEYINTYFC